MFKHVVGKLRLGRAAIFLLAIDYRRTWLRCIIINPRSTYGEAFSYFFTILRYLGGFFIR